MNDEMILRYLCFLTYMYSGTEHWENNYQKWREFGEYHKEYNKLIDKVMAFKKKYKNKT